MRAAYGGGHEAAHVDADANGFQNETRVEHSSGSLEWRCRDRIRRWAREGSLQNGGLEVAGFVDAPGSVDAPGLGAGLEGAASGEPSPGEADGSPRVGDSAGDLIGAAASSGGARQLESGPMDEEGGAVAQEVRFQFPGSTTDTSTM